MNDLIIVGTYSKISEIDLWIPIIIVPSRQQQPPVQALKRPPLSEWEPLLYLLRGRTLTYFRYHPLIFAILVLSSYLLSDFNDVLYSLLTGLHVLLRVVSILVQGQHICIVRKRMLSEDVKLSGML